MAELFVGIGSNQNAAVNVRAAVAGLQALLGPLQLSSVYESEAVGFVGPPFLNLVARATTALTLDAVVAGLRAIETALGRRRAADAEASCHSADLDLLLYDQLCVDVPVVLPRPEILTNAFVLWPLAELAPELRHPQNGRSYGELWAAYDRASQQLAPVDFRWPDDVGY
ncbi:MAG: 2-amino-4-hydroxy-6-hydroxymethyldihydropteridine diphosphokinase [Gammaproteobacteria bacterium]|nr:2-amino-4-hydroxy-6-hydroxymethyldihydropteridine diphosphokinase [Gammaproteobacteria bacterium]